MNKRKAPASAAAPDGGEPAAKRLKTAKSAKPVASAGAGIPQQKPKSETKKLVAGAAAGIQQKPKPAPKSESKQLPVKAKAESKEASTAAAENGDPADVEARQRLRRAAYLFAENFVKKRPALSPPDFSMAEISKACLGKFEKCTALPDGLPAAQGAVKDKVQAISWEHRWQAFCGVLDLFCRFPDKRPVLSSGKPSFSEEDLSQAKLLQEAISAKRRRKLKRKKTTKKHQAAAKADPASAGSTGAGKSQGKNSSKGAKAGSAKGSQQKSLKGKREKQAGAGRKSKKDLATATADDFDDDDLKDLAKGLNL